MAIFKNRKTAICVFIAVVVVFTLIGSHLSLSRACAKIEDAFFDKSLLQAEDYHTCPGDQLKNCVKLANRLLSVIGSDGVWENAYMSLRDCRAMLDDALERRDIPAAFEQTSLLMDAVAKVEATRAAGAPLPDSSDDFDAIVSDIYSAQRVSADPAYNRHVQTFIDGTLSVFPTNILRRLTGVSLPESYR